MASTVGSAVWNYTKKTLWWTSTRISPSSDSLQIVAVLYVVPMAIEATHDQMKMLQELEKSGAAGSSGPAELVEYDVHSY